MYFDKFPITEYDFDSVGIEGKEVLDILIRLRFLFNNAFADRAYTKYILEHGDTPDIIAHKYYGNSDWWWLVLLYNDIINPFNELPRLGFDNKSSPGSGPKPNPVVYIEKSGGDEFSDFKEGDIIVKSFSPSRTIKVGGAGTRKVFFQPQPLQPSNADFATAKIIKWRDSFREATLSDVHGSNFYVGDTVGVIIKEKNGTNRFSYWGKILLALPNNTDAIDHLIENRSGRVVHPHYNRGLTAGQEGKIKSVGPRIIRGDTTKSLQGTLINAVLGGSGSSGTTYSNRFTAITVSETVDDYSRGEIKLLDDTYKDEAYNLLTTLLSNRNMTYATFSTTVQKTFSIPFFNLPSSNNNNITTIY